MMITGVVTQGRPDYPQWVESYSISYSIDGALFKTYRELRNVDKVTFFYFKYRVMRSLGCSTYIIHYRLA